MPWPRRWSGSPTGSVLWEMIKEGGTRVAVAVAAVMAVAVGAAVGAAATTKRKGVTAVATVPSSRRVCTCTIYSPGVSKVVATCQAPSAATVVVATSVLSMSTSSMAPGAAAPVRVTVLVFTPRAKTNSPNVGMTGVDVWVGSAVAVGGGTLVALGVAVAVGKASTKAFIGTLTESC